MYITWASLWKCLPSNGVYTFVTHTTRFFHGLFVPFSFTSKIMSKPLSLIRVFISSDCLISYAIFANLFLSLFIASGKSTKKLIINSLGLGASFESRCCNDKTQFMSCAVFDVQLLVHVMTSSSFINICAKTTYI